MALVLLLSLYISYQLKAPVLLKLTYKIHQTMSKPCITNRVLILYLRVTPRPLNILTSLLPKTVS